MASLVGDEKNDCLRRSGHEFSVTPDALSHVSLAPRHCASRSTTELPLDFSADVLSFTSRFFTASGLALNGVTAMYYGRYSREQQRWIIQWPTPSTMVAAHKRVADVERADAEMEQAGSQSTEASKKTLEPAAGHSDV